MLRQGEPITVFCSYAHVDEELRQELERHLSPLRRQGLLSTWLDRLITPGSEWAKIIDTQLNSAGLILLLISPDFFASDYCYGTELQRAMERHAACVIPVLLRPVVDWDKAPFAELMVLPTNAQPITSWPNRDEAWADVVAGIRRAIEELSPTATRASHTTLPPVWNVPYARNPVFTGREDLLAGLAMSLRSGQAMAISQPQAISGLGGIGKTQLAVEYAYRYRRDYQAVLWIRAENREALISGFADIAALLHLPEQNAQDLAIVMKAVKDWMKTHDRWLWILDNADDLKIIQEFLPPTHGGHVLLTTRAQAMIRLAQRVDVDTLAPDVGALFLLRRVGVLAPDASFDQASHLDRAVAMQLSAELGGLPLALDQAGAYIEETGCGLADYLQLYQRYRAELLKERRGLIADHPESVTTTVSLAVERVERRHPAAADLLRLCTFLASGLNEQIIIKGAPHLGPFLGPVAADRFLLNQAVEVLRASSLVQRDPTHQALSIHKLIQTVLRDTMSTEEATLWVKRAARAVKEALSDRPLSVSPLPSQGVFGRDESLADISTHFLDTGESSPIVLWGMGGVGKTTLAFALGRQADILNSFPDGVLAVKLGPTPNIRTLLNDWGRTLGIDLVPERDEAACRDRLRERRVLLIIDDVWEVEHGSYFQVAGPYCPMLFTTRESALAYALASGYRAIRVDVLSPEAALQLLDALVPEAVAADRREARRLCEKVGHLPLALVLFGRLLANEVDVSRRMQRLVDELTEQYMALGYVEGRKGLAEDHAGAVRAALDLSVNSLSQLDQERFAQLAVFGGEPMTWEINAAAYVWECSQEEAEVTTAHLIRQGLVNPQPELRYCLPTLIADYAERLLTELEN